MEGGEGGDRSHPDREGAPSSGLEPQVLCNSQFGWLTDETGNGLLWTGGNSREGKLTPWSNDPLAIGGPEKIMVSLEEKEWSVFADGDGCPCTVTYGPGFARWEKQMGTGRLVTEAFVPLIGTKRILTFTLAGTSGTLSYRMGEGEPMGPPSCPGTAFDSGHRAGTQRAGIPVFH